MARARYIVVGGTLALLNCVHRPSKPAEQAGAGCLPETKPAIVVEIRDATTGAALAQLARGVVQHGAYSDSLIAARSESSDPTTMYARRAANERPGTYDVWVERVGYRDWHAYGVRVGAGPCGVSTVQLQARLRRL